MQNLFDLSVSRTRANISTNTYVSGTRINCRSQCIEAYRSSSGEDRSIVMIDVSRCGAHGTERGEYWRLRSQRLGTVRANTLTAVFAQLRRSLFWIIFLHLRADRYWCIFLYSNLSQLYTFIYYYLHSYIQGEREFAKRRSCRAEMDYRFENALRRF